MLSRRHFLGASLATTVYAAGSFVPVWAQNAPNFGTPTLPSPGFRRMKVGDVEVIALNDGITRRPLGEEFVKNAPLAEVRALLASQGLPTDYIDVPYTPFLVVTGARKILIDTGLGEFGGATTGKLLDSLRAAGMQASDIDTVLVSHYHGDHINGIRNKAGELVFPKAKVMVPAAEHAFWMDDARMAAAPAGMKGAFDNVRRTFATMPADALVRFEAGTEVAPGIQSVAAYGHTPGHTLFELKSAGQNFFYVADLTNVPALFARNPDWAVTFDMDAEAARKVRREVFQRITTSNAMLGGFHFPFPAFGRVAAAGNGYAFQPAA
ncbi:MULTISPECIES: MBL fold metallo-hydrolase [unclassified Acidovorax]|uniref:MBL fold metallo-hydrolase n=1 Tax=unclassified Acidovorax TaxID=2684926 RepID=UPI000C17BB40|nr:MULTISPECIES: MBL fold metallo-hydrolase [unclassified Acidovorax]PIF18935.1 glyoxylase-like metal-dependent hydrolase (beta-lactamase superfamily II) [Acidovorax sp. 59]PKW02039.1 glyoxylase-like metal-dependent hydrolase (beta-lactamase superfamily II) [Acidovorax sp. 30]